MRSHHAILESHMSKISRDAPAHHRDRRNFSNDSHRHTRVLTALCVMAVFYTLYFGRAFFIPVVLAVFLGFILSPVVRVLTRIRVPEKAGAAMVLIVAAGIIYYTVTMVSGPATQWLSEAPRNWQQVERKIQGWIRP